MSALVPQNLQYNILSSGSTAAAAASTTFLLRKGWKLFTKNAPPVNPAQPGVLWSEALLYGALAGMVAGMLGVVAKRVAAAWWRTYVGPRPGDSNL
jgi:hypothetical protein